MAAALELGEAELRQPDGGEEQELDRLFDLLVGDAFRNGSRRSAAVVDEDVDAAESLERAVVEALQVGRVRHVAAHRQPADSLGLALEQLSPASEHGDVRALGRERLGNRQAHPRRGAANDRRPAR